MKINSYLINKMRAIFHNHNIILDSNITPEDEYKLYEEINNLYKNKILTCVYCGKIYPEGTPTYESEILTDHIKVCKKHPLRDSEKKINILKTALYDIVGVDKDDGLENLKLQIPNLSIPVHDKKLLLYGIDALLKTL